MAQPKTSRNAAVGVGEESTYGTAVSRTNWRPIRPGGSLQRRTVTAPIDDMYTGAGFGSPRRAVDADESGGRVSLMASYTRMGMLLKHALGSLATTGPSGAGAYVHTYTIGALPPGLSLELLRGNATNSELFEGCRVSGFELSVAARGRMTLNLDFIAETSTRPTAGTATFGASDDFILHSQAGTLAFNSVAYTLRSMTLTGDNGLERRDLLGSIKTAEPAEAQNRVFTMVCEMEDSDDNFYTAEAAQTETDAVLTFTGSGNNAATITLRNCTVEVSDPVSARGILVRTVTFYGKPDGTDKALTIAVTNDNSSGTVN